MSETISSTAPSTGVDAFAASFVSTDQFSDVIAITKEILPGEVSISLMVDPEYPEYEYTIVRAVATGETHEIIDRELLWHRRVDKTACTDRDFRLALDYQ